MAGVEGFEPSNAGIKIRDLQRIHDGKQANLFISF